MMMFSVTSSCLLAFAGPRGYHASSGTFEVLNRLPVALMAKHVDEFLSQKALSNDKATESMNKMDKTPESMNNFNSVLALNLVTIIWGSQHAVIKDLVESIPPSALNSFRFGVAALLSARWLPNAHRLSSDDSTIRSLRSEASMDQDAVALQPFSSAVNSPPEEDKGAWLAGLELGIWMFAGYALQAVGLQFTTASRSAFLLYLNVKLVPLFALLVYGKQSDAKTWISAFIAFCGTTLLSYDGQPPNIGDGFSLAAAAASALFILKLEFASRAHKPATLNATTLASCAALCLVWAACDITFGDNPMRFTEALASVGDYVPQLLYLSVVTTAVANWLQTAGQAGVRAQDAAVIYSLDPVYGAAFSWLLLGETIGPQGFVGGGLVLAAVGLSRLNSDVEQKPSQSSIARSSELKETSDCDRRNT